MLAVIRTGGKQYRVAPGQRIKIEKIEGEEGNRVVFDEVLLVADNGKIEIGQPLVAGTRASGKILEQGRSKKITILKYKPKKRYQVKKGHRQPFTAVEINAVEQE